MYDFLSSEPWILLPLVAIGGGFVCAICGMITCTIKNVVATKQFEQSRREIAAYIAEGTMSPEDGARILQSGKMQESA